MDHLPYPSEALLPPIPVPYIASNADKYDGLGFVDFPIRCGWASTDGQTKWYHCTEEIALCRAQSWLFFGLLHEFLGPNFNSNDFIRVDDATGQALVTTQCLPRLLRQWLGPLIWPFTQYTSREVLAGLLDYPLLFGIFNRLTSRLRRGTSRLPFRLKFALVTTQEECEALSNRLAHCSPVILSIEALLWSLRNTASNKDLRLLLRTELGFLTSLFLGIECCRLVTVLSGSIFGSIVFPWRPYTISLACKIQESDTKIAPMNVVLPTKSTKTREVPLIRISSHACSDAVNIEIVKAAMDNPFVAISHVWSSGMGNPHGLSLPNCQLLRIMQLAKTHDSKSKTAAEQCTVWIDTLCVPPRSPGDTLRRQAINQMTRIYSEAKAVLVLDHEPRSIGDDCPEERRLALLLTSAWMTRCWTFQEGRLAQYLRVETSSGKFDPFETFDWLANEFVLFRNRVRRWEDNHQFIKEMLSCLYRLRPLADTSEEHRQVHYLVSVWNELSARNTSRREDMLMVLANMMDLSPSEVLSLSPEQRMPAILGTQSALPLCLLTDGQSGEQKDPDLCRWMPRDIKTPLHLDRGLLQKVTDNMGGDYVVDVDGDDWIVLRSSQNPDTISNCLLVLSPPTRSIPKVHMTLRNSITTTHAQRSGLGLVFILHRERQRRDQLRGTGCVLRIRQGDSRRIVAGFESAFTYTVTTAQSRGDPCEADLPLIAATRVDQKTEIRIDCDRQQWPSLSFNRSLEAAFVTTTAEPFHDIAAALWLGQLLLWVTAGALVLVVYWAHDFDLWFDGTPVLYALWGVCVLCMAIRIYICFRYEVGNVNATLVSIEYNKWTRSFDASDRDVSNSSTTMKPLSQSYQFYSWTLAAVVWSCGLAVFVIGLAVAPPKLRFLAYAGGALLIEMTVRVSSELLWRLSGAGKPMRRLLRKIEAPEQRNYDRIGDAGSAWNVLLGGFKREWVVPTIWSRNAKILREAFEDPVYISGKFD